MEEPPHVPIAIGWPHCFDGPHVPRGANPQKEVGTRWVLRLSEEMLPKRKPKAKVIWVNVPGQKHPRPTTWLFPSVRKKPAK